MASQEDYILWLSLPLEDADQGLDSEVRHTELRENHAVQLKARPLNLATSAEMVKKKQRRSIQDESQTCLICNREQKNMRRHLTVAHDLDAAPKQFFLSFFRTRKIKDKVYQCQDCLVRFANPRRRGPQGHMGHAVSQISIKTSTDEFPEPIKALLSKSYQPTKVFKEVVDSFVAYRNNLLNTDGKESISSTAKMVILRMCSATDKLKNPLKLNAFLAGVQKQLKWKSATVLIHLSLIKKFIMHVNMHFTNRAPLNSNAWIAVISEIREVLNKQASRETIQTTAKLLSCVPEIKVVKETYKRVINILKHDLTANDVTHKESMAFNFYAFHTIIDTRQGPIINIKTADFREMKDGEIRRITDHKTGYIYPVAIMIPPELRPYLEAMISKYIVEFGKTPTYLFSSSTDVPTTTMATTVKEVFDDRFGKSKYSFNSTSIRKSWDTYCVKNPEFQQKHGRAHEAQTGHSKETRDKYYAKKPNDSEFKGLLSDMSYIINKNVRKNMPSHGSVNNEENAGGCDTAREDLGSEEEASDMDITKERQPNAEEDVSDMDVEMQPNERDSNEGDGIWTGLEKPKITGKYRRNPVRTQKKQSYFEDGQESGDDDVIEFKDGDRSAKPIPLYLKETHMNRQGFKNQKPAAGIQSKQKMSQESKQGRNEYAECGGRELFIRKLKTVRGSRFSFCERKVLEGLHYITEAPTKPLVRERYKKLAVEPNEDAVNRIYTKAAQAWLKAFKRNN